MNESFARESVFQTNVYFRREFQQRVASKENMFQRKEGNVFEGIISRDSVFHGGERGGILGGGV